MSSRHPLESEFGTPASSEATSSSVPTNAFAHLMASKGSSSFTAKQLSQRDLCKRPIPVYNINYNPNEPLPNNLPLDYSPYVPGEPLYDDRPLLVARLPPQYTLAPSSKKPRRSWVWNLGYVLVDNKRRDRVIM
jgi:hypothetical protein